MSDEHYTTLVAALQQVPDPRDRRGRQHRWDDLLTLIAAAVVAGQRGGRAMAQWMHEHEAALVAGLQPKRGRVPSRATVGRVLAKVPLAELEEQCSGYAAHLDTLDAQAGAVPLTPEEREETEGVVLRGQSVDGKTVRTASAYGVTHHLVSLVRHASGVVLAQAEVAVKLDERKLAQALLTPARVAGTVTTLDALHTQRTLAAQIVEGGGHYLLMVKRNQRSLYEALELAFSILPPTTPADAADAQAWGYAQHETVDQAHGRREVRMLERLTGLKEYLDWPGVAQVLRRTCHRTKLATGETSCQVRYGITSLPPDQVSLAQTEQVWRQHWTIENTVHYVRDVSLGEDAGRMRAGNAVAALATLRNVLMALLRCEGWPSLPTACRHFAAHPQLALQLIGAISS
jgi:predicted transposase YbfD/YdcC